MKKIAAIFLLVLFTFNLIGYKLLFAYLQHRNDVQLSASLDKEEYNESDLITVRIPVSVAYQAQSSGFERVYGEINLNGIIYKYVKRKIDNGELILMCLPDRNKTSLRSAEDEYGRVNNEPQQITHSRNANQKSASVLILTVYENLQQDTNNSLIVNIKTAQFGSYNGKLISTFQELFTQPPEIHLA